MLLRLFVVSCCTALWQDAALAEPLQRARPEDVRIEGDLADRMKRAVEYLDLASRQQLWSGFEAELTDDHSFGLWAADWPGRTLEAYARVSLVLGEAASARFDEVGFGLLANQRRDGAFKNGRPVAPERTGYAYSNGYWFGNARGMLGLIWAHRYRPQNPAYLEAARKLGDHFIEKYFAAGQLGAPSSFWWVGTEAMVELYRVTADRKYLDLALRIADSVPAVNPISQHTHSYLLAVRGMVNICDELRGEGEADARTRLLAKALKQHAYFEEQVMWPGGGIVEHLGQREGFSLNYWFDEGCSVFDWWGLNVDLWRVTRDTRFLDMAERVARNHLLYNQDQSGGFCGDRGIDFVREGSPWPFCCAMHGTRSLAEIPQYIATTDQELVFISFFYPSTTKLTVAGRALSVELQSQYLTRGTVRVSVETEEKISVPVKIRVPHWSKVLELRVDGKRSQAMVAEGWCVIEREWQGSTTIEIKLDLPLRTEPRNQFIGDSDETDLSQVSLWHGPRQLVYNQSLNGKFWGRAQAEPALRHVYQAYGDLHLDQSVNGTPLRIGEKSYEKGLGTHAVSEITYWLDGQFKEFRSDIGIDASAEGAGAVRYKVCVDGMLAHGDVVKASIGEENAGQVQSLYGFEVSAISGAQPARSIRVDVAGARLLTLVVDEAVNGLAKDYANWGNARLTKPEGAVVYLSDLPDHSEAGLPIEHVELLTTDVVAQEKDRVLLNAVQGEAKVPVVFSFLDSLGSDLRKQRPVLRSYVKVKTE